MDAEEAERYLMGDSPDEEAADLEEHLLLCAALPATDLEHRPLYLFDERGGGGSARERAASPHRWTAGSC